MDKIFKILFLSIPRVVYDRNLHDRCTDFGETAQYIINKFENKNVTVDIYDMSIPCATIRSIYRLFAKKYDLVVFYTDITESHMVKKLCKILKILSPESRNFIYGDSTLTIPQFFERSPFDAFHIDGDQEASISSYVEYMLSGNRECLRGVCICECETIIKYSNGLRLLTEEWALPPIDKLPIEEYKKFAKEFKNSIYACSIYISKGCSKRCKYCLCLKREGVVDRRRSINQVIDFLEANKNNFKLFKLHSADFLADRQWVIEFCEEMIRRKINVKWKGTACFSSMDEEIIKLCYDAGCVGIGFGVETFYKNKDMGMKLKVSEFERNMKLFSKYPIKYKGFIMLGTENQMIDDVKYTIDILNKYNVIIRPATYTPFHLLSSYSVEELDNLDLEDWNKKECIQVINKEIAEIDIYKVLLNCKL
ncbi:MAG: hypothetical protein K0R54_625 [Clostridiaceae bacterium]|jgi:radical SAM superfamily enzyme YgiQ (UPF0313 family)|nr:hypothetical protein [Clostridiaceae bacterium]